MVAVEAYAYAMDSYGGVVWYSGLEVYGDVSAGSYVNYDGASVEPVYGGSSEW